MPFFYGPAKRNTPQYYVGYLTFQDGTPFTRTASVTGGGDVPVQMPVGTFRPFVQNYGTRMSSSVGGGLLLNDPLRLSALLQPPGSRGTLG